jgi:hypothetical protein
LISSYYYATLVGFRYSAAGKVDMNYHPWTLAFEAIFLIHLLLQFLIEYRVEGEKMPIKEPAKIAMNYINNGDFYFDFICLIPF